MTENSEYKARVRAKGLEHTGVTEDVARGMYGRIEGTTLAVVEVEHVRQVNDAEKGRTVELKILTFEPATDSDLENTLRELLRSLVRQRKNLSGADTPLPLPGEPAERSVKDVVTSIRAHQADQPHDFEAADDPTDDGCVLCGGDFDDPLHAPAENPEPTLPDADDDTADEQPRGEIVEAAEALYAAAHAESDETTGAALCGLPERPDRDVNVVDDPDDVTCRLCLGLLEDDEDPEPADDGLDPVPA